MQDNNPKSSSGYQGAAIVLISFGVFMAAILMVLSVSGGSDTTHPSDAGDPALEHVHGLGVDPEDGMLYVASHSGVFRVTDAGPERVADRYQDTMGFAVVGPQRFLASGHPDLREDLPSHLGLIESVDGAETWNPLSLTGEADLHVIEPTDSGVYAYNSALGQLIASDDRQQWDVIDTRPIVDIAADGTGTILATSPEGKLLHYDPGTREPTTVANAPALSYIDWESPELLVGVTLEGDVFTSESGETWQAVGSAIGPVVAFDAVPGVWHVATEAAVYSSTDAGRTWTVVLETG